MEVIKEVPKEVIKEVIKEIIPHDQEYRYAQLNKLREANRLKRQPYVRSRDHAGTELRQYEGELIPWTSPIQTRESREWRDSRDGLPSVSSRRASPHDNIWYGSGGSFKK